MFGHLFSLVDQHQTSPLFTEEKDVVSVISAVSTFLLTDTSIIFFLMR